MRKSGIVAFIGLAFASSANAAASEDCGLGRMKMERVFNYHTLVENWAVPDSTVLAKGTVLVSQTYAFGAKLFRLKESLSLAPILNESLPAGTEMTLWRTGRGVVPCGVAYSGPGGDLVCLFDRDSEGRYRRFDIMNPQGFWRLLRESPTLVKPAEVIEDTGADRLPGMLVTKQIKIKSAKPGKIGYLIIAGQDRGRSSAPNRQFDKSIQDEDTVAFKPGQPLTIAGLSLDLSPSSAGLTASASGELASWGKLSCEGSRVFLGRYHAADEYGFSLEVEID